MIELPDKKKKEEKNKPPPFFSGHNVLFCHNLRFILVRYLNYILGFFPSILKVQNFSFLFLQILPSLVCVRDDLRPVKTPFKLSSVRILPPQPSSTWLVVGHIGSTKPCWDEYIMLESSSLSLTKSLLQIWYSCHLEQGLGTTSRKLT